MQHTENLRFYFEAHYKALLFKMTKIIVINANSMKEWEIECHKAIYVAGHSIAIDFAVSHHECLKAPIIFCLINFFL